MVATPILQTLKADATGKPVASPGPNEKAHRIIPTSDHDFFREHANQAAGA